jgi:hypothetical protein
MWSFYPIPGKKAIENCAKRLSGTRGNGRLAAAVSSDCRQTYRQYIDMHGGFVKGAARPPSHDILAKSEYISDFALKLSTLCRQL